MDEKIINNVLLEHHILPNKKGHYYIRNVIKLYLDGNYANLKQLYTIVANRCNVKINTVEKNISNVISESFEYIEIAERYADYADINKGKLTNKQFIEILARQIHNL